MAIGLGHIKKKLEKIEREIRSAKQLINNMNVEEPIDNVQEFIAFFCDAWKARYKHHPKMSGQSIGALKTILKDFGNMRARAMVQGFIKMNDAFFIKRRHDPMTLKQNVMAVGHYVDSGDFITKDDARQAERTHKAQTLFDMVDEGKL